MVQHAASRDLRFGVARMLEEALTPGTQVDISPGRRVFGGNARQAWAFQACWTDAGTTHREEVILMLRPQGSQVSTSAETEYTVLSYLHGRGVRAPRIWAQDPQGRHVPGSAVLLELLPGSANAVDFLRADPIVGRRRTLDLARTLAELHSANLPIEHLPTLSLAQLRADFEQVRREPHPTLAWVLDWLEDRQSTPLQRVLVHGDFRPGNVLYDQDRIVGVLDWELAHVGDAAEDIAWAYRKLWSPERFLTLDEFIDEYERAGGLPVSPSNLLWNRIYAEVRFAVISLRGSRSFADGITHNLRLIDRARTVLLGLDQCLEWIAKAEEGGHR